MDFFDNLDQMSLEKKWIDVPSELKVSMQKKNYKNRNDGDGKPRAMAFLT